MKQHKKSSSINVIKIERKKISELNLIMVFNVAKN